MVENYQIELKIEEVITKARWDSIDNDYLDKCEKDREWYLDYTKKEEHPMAYQVKKEIEESERFAPHSILYPNEVREIYYNETVWDYYMFCIGAMFFMFGIGLYLATRIILS